MSKKHLVRRNHELDKNSLELLEKMTVDEQGLFKSPFLIENEYAFIPESTLRLFQDTILKYFKG